MSDLEGFFDAVLGDGYAPDQRVSVLRPILQALTYPCREPIHQRAAGALGFLLQEHDKEPTP